LLNYLKHRISNAASERINSQNARIIAKALGLACFENLHTRVLFFLGKLDLSPA
jgi:transposase